MKTWKGRILHPDLPGGRGECVVSIGGTTLLARLSAGGEHRLDLRTAGFRIEGYQEKSYAFLDPAESRFVISSEEASFWEEVRRLPIPELQKTLAGFRSEKRKAFLRKVMIPSATLVLLIVATPFLLRLVLVEVVVKAVPVSVDNELGRLGLQRALQENGAGGREVTDGHVRGAVQQIVQRLLAEVPQRGFEFQVHVVSSALVNAFALPGGHIVVTTALLETAGSPEEVAGVLAHEMAHVTERHGVKRVVQDVSLWIVVSAVFGDVGTIGSLIFGQSATLASLGYSRDMERQADAEGVRLLQRAKVDLSGLRRFLERLQERSDSADSVLRFLSTHPLTAERLQRIDEQIRAAGPIDPVGFSIDWKQMKTEISSKLQDAGTPDAAGLEPLERLVEVFQ